MTIGSGTAALAGGAISGALLQIGTKWKPYGTGWRHNVEQFGGTAPVGVPCVDTGTTAMFLVVQRTDTLPEIRAIVNTDHVVAVMPVAGGIKTKLYLSNGDSWDVALAFTRAVTIFRDEVGGAAQAKSSAAAAGS